MTAGARQRTHERAGLALELVWRPCGGHLVTRGSLLPPQTLESLHNRTQKGARQKGWTWSRRPLCSFLADADGLLEAAQKQTWAPGLDWSPSLSWAREKLPKTSPRVHLHSLPSLEHASGHGRSGQNQVSRARPGPPPSEVRAGCADGNARQQAGSVLPDTTGAGSGRERGRQLQSTRREQYQ